MHIDVKHICEMLARLEVPEAELMLAGRLYDRDCIDLVEVNEELFSEAALVYHFDPSRIGRLCGSKLYDRDCDMLRGRMKLRNGVVLKKGHADLCCSRHTCGYKVCPLALAACFRACRANEMLKDDIPLLSDYFKKKREISQADEFVAKWADKLGDAQVALNLMVSEREDDFTGSIVIRDRSNLREFINDTYELMRSMGEVENFVDEEGVERRSLVTMSLLTLMSSAEGEDASESIIQNGLLPPNYLFVLDGLSDFCSVATLAEGQPGQNMHFKRFYDCLGSIADDRYVLIVGTEGEVSRFCSLDKRFEATFGQHRMFLPVMSTSEVLGHYVRFLDTEVRDQITDMDAFAVEFRRFLGFNRDSLPYTGRELADYLAKHANALRRPKFPQSAYKASSLDEMLDSVVGLQQVKDTIHDLENYVTMRKLAEAEGKDLQDMSLHMLFTGNPGTGKTMMAKMISTMLYKIGIIQRNECVEVTAKDLVAGFVGQTSMKTDDKVQEAIGGILFVDEAYGLASDGRDSTFGAQAVDELVKAMDQYKDRLIVILAGYEKEMAEFMETNPGLASRIGYKFRFEDYSTDELMQIFTKCVKAQGFACDEEVMASDLPELFGYYRNFQSFGNGRFVRQVISRMIVKHARAYAQGKVADDRTFTFSSDDVPTRQELNDITDWTPRPARELLEPLVGIEEVKKRVEDLERVVTFQERARKHNLKLPDSNMHMLFTGNPGTGKTTVARIVGKIMYNVGALPTDKFVEIEARDLAKYNTHTGQNEVGRIIQSAMGGVLFVDEAYAILTQSGADDIIATLVKAMEDHKGEFVVMFAGYENEMQRFVDRNPGLASRIGYKFHFADYETDELQEIFERKVASSGFTLTDEAKVATRAVFKYFHNVEDFGNGRFVDKVFQEVISKHAGNSSSKAIDVLDAEDVPTIEEMGKTSAASVYIHSDAGNEEAKREVAVHEIGHAICMFALWGEASIQLITIEAEGNGALGYVQPERKPIPDRTAQDLRNSIAIYLGGLAAEELVLGAYGSGGSSDLEQATLRARSYVGHLGLSQAGFVQYVGRLGLQRGEGIHNLPQNVRDAMTELLDEEFAHAKEVISYHREAYDAMVDVLCGQGTITGDEMAKIWNDLKRGDNNE